MDHRIERAWERYGVGLNLADLDRILALATKANLVSMSGPSSVHCVVWSGVAMLPVVRVGDDGQRFIATFQPADCFGAESKRDRRRACIKKGHKETGWLKANRIKRRHAARAEINP